MTTMLTWRGAKSFIVDVCVDGYALIGFAAPALSLAYTLAKAFEVPIMGLHELSYAWAFAPLMLWFFVAYVRRRAQTDRTRKIVGLKSFYVSVGPIIDRGLQREAAAEVFDAYLKEADDWIATAAAWIKDNMGMTARERFLDRTGMFASSYSTAINETHNNVISNLTRHRQNLSALIERDAWDDH